MLASMTETRDLSGFGWLKRPVSGCGCACYRQGLMAADRYGERQMDLHEEKKTAEEVRQAVRKKRLERSRERNYRLEAAPVALGALLPISGDDRTLWPKTQWENPLTLTLPRSDFIEYGYGETLEYKVNGSHLQTNVLDSPSDVEVIVPVDVIKEAGRYLFSYHYTQYDGNEADSSELQFTVDKVPPNEGDEGPPPTLPVEVVANGLTLQYLNDNAYLDISVSRTKDMLAGDNFFISWVPSLLTSRQSDPFEPITSKPITVDDVVPEAGDPVVRLEADFVKTLSQGRIAVVYRYQDRTGNFGAYSGATYIEVDLNPGPAGLQTPEVDLAFDGWIDRADALLGVEVEIPAPSYENAKPEADQIEVVWENIRLPLVPVSSFPMVFLINWATLSAQGAENARTFEVGYNVVRGVSKTPSPRLTVNVNFSVAGPPPVGLDPVNINLPPVVVKSRNSSAPDNQLTEADLDLSATAQLQLYNKVQAGQVLKLYWGTLSDPVSEITLTTESPGATVAFEVAWADIVRGGYNEKLPIYYTTSNGINVQQSALTEVSVTIIPIEGLVDVEFPGRWSGSPADEPFINCGSKPWEGIDVVMPGNAADMQPGATVVFSWRGYSDRDGTMLIPGTEFTFDPITVTPEHVAQGIEFKVPYADLVEPVTNGSGLFTYELSKDSGQRGSHSTRVRISRKTGSTFCSASSRTTCISGEDSGLETGDAQ
ncbi:hypothetical protein ALP19_100814 [Pseudomonas syringae pv. tomato]|nr:hypothetical protein ALP19_100814 [Pseudomonas syringae pv. tomato]